MGYEVRMGRRALKQLGRLPGPIQERLAPRIESLAEEPRPACAKRLVAGEELWRIRVGAYRIIYAIEDDVLLVLVVKIGHRRDVYRSG